ncbi:short chain dehydrogenase/reductase, partial [Flagelloscypha sp. PMI_526]
MSSSSTNNEDFQVNKIFNVQDKIAIITGGGSGIGLMATQALAVNGAKVYIVGRTKEKLDQVVKIHGQNIPGQIIPLVGDVTDKTTIAKLAEEVRSREKHVDILINNAGIAPEKEVPEEEDATKLKQNLFETTSVEEWTSVYATNVVGPYLLSVAFLPLLDAATKHRKGSSSTIINITSISGMVKISQGHFSYNASKAALIHLNRMLATEIAKIGLKIRVNAIAPGVFPSEMTTQESGEDQKSFLPKEHKEGLPSARPGQDMDIASVILFAASCQYLNGQNIAVDGGHQN